METYSMDFSGSRANFKTFQFGQVPPQGYGIKRWTNISTVSPDSIGIED